MRLSPHGLTGADGGKIDECFEAPYEEYPITICG